MNTALALITACCQVLGAISHVNGKTVNFEVAIVRISKISDA